jgi:hypothetical protein
MIAKCAWNRLIIGPDFAKVDGAVWSEADPIVIGQRGVHFFSYVQRTIRLDSK